MNEIALATHTKKAIYNASKVFSIDTSFVFDLKVYKVKDCICFNADDIYQLLYPEPKYPSKNYSKFIKKYVSQKNMVKSVIPLSCRKRFKYLNYKFYLTMYDMIKLMANIDNVIMNKAYEFYICNDYMKKKYDKCNNIEKYDRSYLADKMDFLINLSMQDVGLCRKTYS